MKEILLECGCCGTIYVEEVADDVVPPNPEDYTACARCIEGRKAPATYESIVKIVEEWGYRYLTWTDKDPVLVDVTTARVLIKIHDAMSPEKQAKMESLIEIGPTNFINVVDVAWRCMQ